MAHFHLGQFDDAIVNYNLAIEKNPEDPFFYFNLGNVYLNLGKYEEAHKNYGKAIDLSPNNPKFYHSKGLAFEGKATQIME